MFSVANSKAAFIAPAATTCAPISLPSLLASVICSFIIPPTTPVAVYGFKNAKDVGAFSKNEFTP